MQFFVATSLIVTGSAAVVPRSIYFQVSDFTAACIPHSALCDYSFGVVYYNNGENVPVQCSALLVSNGLGTLPPVTDAPCTNSSRTFSTIRNEDSSLTLSVSQAISPATNVTGKYTIPADEIVVEQTGASSQETYTGPTTLDLAWP